MARGWESKAVEAQMEEAANAPNETPPASPDDPQKQHRRNALHLTRSHLTQQLQNTRSVAHRQMLHQSLRAIDEELATLE
jgi:hypothetical protein